MGPLVLLNPQIPRLPFGFSITCRIVLLSCSSTLIYTFHLFFFFFFSYLHKHLLSNSELGSRSQLSTIEVQHKDTDYTNNR